MIRPGFHWFMVTLAWALSVAYLSPASDRGLLLIHISSAIWLGGKMARADVRGLA